MLRPVGGLRRGATILALALAALVLLSVSAVLSMTAPQGTAVFVVGLELRNSQPLPVPAGFQMPVLICNSSNATVLAALPHIVNATLYNMTDPDGQNVYFSSSPVAPSPNLYSWFEGTVTNRSAACRVWWVRLPSGIGANGTEDVYMYVGPRPADYYAEFYPYVGTNAQVLGTMNYDNGQYVFVAYGYFNNTLDGWASHWCDTTAGWFTNTKFFPTPTPYGIEMTTPDFGECTFITPPDDWHIPEAPIVVEEAWYASNEAPGSGADANVIALFGNDSGNRSIYSVTQIGSTDGGNSPAPNGSTFVQFEYWGSAPYLYLKSTIKDSVLAKIPFTESSYTFYTWFWINGTYAEAGYYEYNSSLVWAPLTLLGTLNSTGEVGASLTYKPYQYPTLMIGAGTGSNYGYQYEEWAIARYYPPDGEYPSVRLFVPTFTSTFTVSKTLTLVSTSTVTATTTTTRTVVTSYTAYYTSTVTATSTSTVTATTFTTTVSPVTATSTVTRLVVPLAAYLYLLIALALAIVAVIVAFFVSRRQGPQPPGAA